MIPLLLALAPLVVLGALVARGLPTVRVALVAVAVAAVVAVTAFGAGPAVMGVATAKGVWSGLWILYVTWPATLLYRVAAAAGLDRVGPQLSALVPGETDRVLLLAWVLPSFVQGVAGFGTPIAVAAPLLLAVGVSPVRAVVLPLIGYQWSVTFGSMGSSFWMAALTGGLDGEGTAALAARASAYLAVDAVLAGTAVAWLHRGWAGLRESWTLLAGAGVAMGVVLQVAVRVEPSVGSLSAGAAGLAAVALHRRLSRDRRPAHVGVVGPPEPAISGAGRDLLVLLTPYLVLLGTVIAVLVPPTSRAWARTVLSLGPALPATTTAQGVTNGAVASHNPIALLAHPGSYMLLAAAVGVVVFRRTGRIGAGELPGLLRAWVRQAWRASPSILLLTTLAAVMVDAGMVRAIAEGVASTMGVVFPAVAPLLGALGSFATGSTTTSNALFGALQADIAGLLDLPAHLLLAAQTVGGNIGNAVAPVVVLVGVTAIGRSGLEPAVSRDVARPVGVLLALAMAASLVVTRL